MGIKDKLMNKLEIGQDGKLGMNDIVTIITQCEGGAVDRAEFLQEVLEGKYPQDVIDKAIKENPVAAGISYEELDAIVDDLANEAINATNIKEALTDVKEITTGGENILKKAGGVAGALTKNRYLVESLRIIQKILYLYGFPQIEISDKGTIQGRKSRICMMISFAVLFDIENADQAIKAVAQALPEIKEEGGIRDLDDGEIGQIIMHWRKKFLAAWTALQAASSNPLAGKVVQKAGFSTSFKKLCLRLTSAIKDTALTNPNHVTSEKEKELIAELTK